MTDDYTAEEIEARFNAALLRMLNTKPCWQNNIVSKRKIRLTPIAAIGQMEVSPQESWKKKGRFK